MRPISVGVTANEWRPCGELAILGYEEMRSISARVAAGEQRPCGELTVLDCAELCPISAGEVTGEQRPCGEQRHGGGGSHECGRGGDLEG